MKKTTMNLAIILAAMIVADCYLWAADAVDGWIERRER
jgi:hypothetical protein